MGQAYYDSEFVEDPVFKELLVECEMMDPEYRLRYDKAINRALNIASKDSYSEDKRGFTNKNGGCLLEGTWWGKAYLWWNL
ncbi:hypothetical protein WICPIJ_006461 [Wickerhamomyces pijperi]|uniref:Uncharacterized protein n=1 Tax=Wickerhamomyces pijperi TaxID=599730 RepID=A0A9P8Q220_WICPI|nr:hypothetical protein WICPIJ_006461 [Wickerhamomyces pijperi]